jgi:hypothetical protein
MRKIFVLIAVLFLSSAMNAQLRVNLNLNLDSQPIWGPTGYDHVENYFLPDYDAYYNVPQHLFYYNEKGRWISRASLPARFHNVDLYSAYKVVINERNPWKNHMFYRDKYISFKGRHDQGSIRDSHEARYYSNKNHPEHNKWMQEQKHGMGHDNGRMKEDNRMNHDHMMKGNDRNKDVKGKDDKHNVNRDKHDNGRN